MFYLQTLIKLNYMPRTRILSLPNLYVYFCTWMKTHIQEA